MLGVGEGACGGGRGGGGVGAGVGGGGGGTCGVGKKILAVAEVWGLGFRVQGLGLRVELLWVSRPKLIHGLGSSPRLECDIWVSFPRFTHY